MKKIEFAAYVDKIYSKARPRFSKGHTYSPKTNRLMEKWIVNAFREAYPDHGIIKTACKLKIEATFKIPTSTPKKEREALMGAPCLKTPDGDNILKQIDALNGIVFEDDRLVYDASVVKVWGPANKLKFTIEW